MRQVPLLIVAVSVMLPHTVGWAAPSRASEAVKHIWVPVAPPRLGLVRALTEAST